MKLLILCMAFSLASKSFVSNSQTLTGEDTTAEASAKPRTDSIYSFAQAELPEEMKTMMSKLTPDGILLFRDEYQGMHNSDSGEALRMLKIWYIDDHIVGYVIDRPVDAGASQQIFKKKINIPVTWCCTPPGDNHPEHCATSVSGLRGFSAGNQCTGWHIKMPQATDSTAQQEPVNGVSVATPKSSRKQ